jgi:hypothetical protein
VLPVRYGLDYIILLASVPEQMLSRYSNFALLFILRLYVALGVNKNSLSWSQDKFSIKFTIRRSKAPAQLFFSAHNKVHILNVYFLHFLKLYPASNVCIPEGQVGTAWVPSLPVPPSVSLSLFPASLSSLHCPGFVR